jgi:hypothetical protein
MKIRQHLYRQPQSMEPLTTFGKMNFKFSIFFLNMSMKKKRFLKYTMELPKHLAEGNAISLPLLFQRLFQ